MPFEGRFFEFIIVGVIALIVVGPKDLPILMRRVGQFVGKLRGMAAEFRASFDELARQSELDELRKEVEALRTARPIDAAAAAIPDEDIVKVFGDIQAGLEESGAQMHPPMSHQTPPSFETPAAEPQLEAPAPEAAPPEIAAIETASAKPKRKPRAKVGPTASAGEEPTA